MRVRYLTKARAERLQLWKYPNFHASGSVQGMKKMFYGEDALLVRSGSYIYKVPENIYYMAK